MREDFKVVLISTAFSCFANSLSAASSLVRTPAELNDLASVVQQADDSYVLTGKVVDENGVPLPGVSVMIQGSKKGVASNVDGKFTIKVRKNDVLRFSFWVTRMRL